MIKVVIFDLGGVLSSDADDFKKTFKEVLTKTGLPFKKVSSIWSQHWPQVRLGKEDLKIVWQEISSQAKKDINPQMLSEIYTKNVSLNKPVFNLAKSLKKKGLQIVILSNESKEGFEAKVNKFKLSLVFDRLFCSAYLGLAKPDLKIFQLALTDLKLKSGQILYIDDEKSNLEAAQKLGIKTIHYRGIKRLEKHIKEFLSGI